MTEQAQLPPLVDEHGKLIQYKGASSSPDCQSCPCSISGKPRAPVPAYGSMGNLLIVGEGPSTEEVQQKHPFVGPSGREMNKIFRKYGIDRHAQWITNALVCPRPHGDAELGKAVMSCRPRLTAEMQTVRPRAVLALGKTAMQALMLDTQTLSDARGTVQESPLLPGVPVITAVHPAALLRGGAGEAASGGSQKQNVDAQMIFLEADVLKAYRISRGEMESQWSDDIMVVIEPEAVQAQPEPQVPGEPPRPTPEIPDEPTVPGVVTDPPSTPEPQEDEPTQPGVPPPETPVTAEPERVGPICSVCKGTQYKTPDGLVCAEGHGGAAPVEPPDGYVVDTSLAPEMPEVVRNEMPVPEPQLDVQGDVLPQPPRQGMDVVDGTPVSYVDDGEKVVVTVHQCNHANTTDAAVGVTCNDCGMRALKGPGGLGEWFAPEAINDWFDHVADQYGAQMVKMDGFDDCVIGVVESFGRPSVLCYDRELVVQKLMKDMTREEAEEFCDFNQQGAHVEDDEEGRGPANPAFLLRREEAI